jgi:hypothetical protein
VGWTIERARLARLSQVRDQDHPDLAAARRDLRFARAEEYIKAVVAAAPPLTTEQIQCLRDALPAPSTQDGSAAA